MSAEPRTRVELPTNLTQAEADCLQRYARDRLVLEMGSAAGGSTVILAAVAKRVHSVDWHKGDDHQGRGDTLASFFDTLIRFGVTDRVVAHVGRFEDVCPVLMPVFELVFVDGFHTFEAAKRDAFLAFSCLFRRSDDSVLQEARIAFHDYEREKIDSWTGALGFDVTSAVQAFCSEFNWEIIEQAHTVAVVAPR